jgi:uncharacterized protein YhdP
VKTFLQKLAWRLTFSIAIIIILAATFVSLSRMLTPYLNNHKHDFEQWASEQLYVPVEIEQVHITWYYLQPVLTFEKVVILDQETQTPNLQIHQIKINLQLLPSLLHWHPLSKYIKVVGANITFREQEGGQWSIEGTHSFIVIHDVKNNTSNPMLTWILSQPHLVLNDINVTYIPLKGNKQFITLDKLSLINISSNHQLSGNAILNQEMASNIVFDLKATGDMTALADMSIQGSFYLKGISLPQWSQQLNWQHLQLIQGLGSTRIEIQWDHGQFQKIESEFQLYDLSVQSRLTKKQLDMSRINGHLNWERDGNKQIFSGRDILIDFPEHFWQTTNFTLVMNQVNPENLRFESLHVDYLDLADTIEVALASGLLPNKTEKMINSLDLNGDLHSLNVSWDGAKGDLTFQGHQTSFALKDFFAKSFVWNELNGAFTFEALEKNGWMITAKNLTLINQDLSSTINFALYLPENVSPILNLTADFSMNNITVIPDYLPVKKLEPSLSHWLQNTFYGGRIINGKAIIKGRLSDFPFDNKNGQFSVAATIRDLDFEYAPKWPGIQHLSGDLVFSGHTMTAIISSGKMLNIPLNKTTATIPYIGANKPQILMVQSVINTDLSKALEYIQQSPLQKIFGKNMASIQLTGPMKLNLALSIPLKTPEKTNVIGDLLLPQADLTIPEWKVSFRAISGAVHFTDKIISNTRLKAIFLNQPIILNVGSAVKSNTRPIVTTTFQSKINKKELETLFNIPSGFFQGSTIFTATLNLTSDDQSRPSELIITSDLKGMSLNLPDIFGKKMNESRPFQFVASMNKKNQGSGIKIEYGNLLSADIQINQNNWIVSVRNAVMVSQLSIKKGYSSQKNIPRTSLQGSLETKDVAKLLSQWGINSSNLVESGGSAEFHLSWNGEPYNPSLNSLEGDISLKLSAGRIIDLSNSTDAKMGIGKMLNLFNLSTLPRRLTLNFKDFKNGYSFDSMNGHFTLKNGSLYTQDTLFDGPIARIEIDGRIGYLAKDYDLNVSVTPYGMTSSLPLLATVVGGPIAGAATWVVDKVVGGAVSNVITHRYKVNGSWSHPNWTEK